MKLEKPITRQSLNDQQKKSYQKLVGLVDSLNTKSLNEGFVTSTNADIEALNKLSDTDKSLAKAIRKTQSCISNRAIKELKFTPKNYYLTLGMSFGMALFGIPFGVAFSFALDNFAFIGIGLPIGLGIGLAIGSGLDKKAESEGRQLDTVVL